MLKSSTYPYYTSTCKDLYLLNSPYSFGFNGKERDNETYGGGNEYDYGFRIYNTRVGRLLSVDPKATHLPNWSPYSYGNDNPVVYIDPDGAFPYTFHIRAFAPSGAFLPTNFHDDGRGFSASTDVISRIKQQFTIDPTAKTFTGGTPTSDPTIWHNMSLTANDKGGISPPKFGQTSSGAATASLSSEFKGSNPFFSGAAPNIEVSSAISIIEDTKNNRVTVGINLSSKQFPATEGILQDSKGNTVFLAGAAAYGEVADLITNDKQTVKSAVITINIDSKGIFQSVYAQGKTFSIKEWNELSTKINSGPIKADDKKE